MEMKRKASALVAGASALLVIAFLMVSASSPVAADSASVSIIGFAFAPQMVEVPAGTTVTWTNNDSAPHTITSNTGLWDSGTKTQGGTFSFTFQTPGTFSYFCSIHPFMTGTIIVTEAEPPPPEPGLQSPQLLTPEERSTISDFNPTLTWSVPERATQYQLDVIPADNDGPGVKIIRNLATSFTIPAPPDWYGLLPDLGYTWRVRVTDATTAVGENDPSWGPWSAESSFRTPKVGSDTISPASPSEGSVVDTLTPTLEWSSSNPNVFYYEVQVSKDPGFNTDPNTATAMVYWELRHGGVTDPPNSYTIAPSFPLEPNAQYFWRVRPRVQGDGEPVPWSPNFGFSTTTSM